MKPIYIKNGKQKIKNRLNSALGAVNSNFYAINSNSSLRKGDWFRFYFPVIGDCLYTMRGCLIKKKNKRKSFVIKASISKESILFTIPFHRTSITIE